MDTKYKLEKDVHGDHVRSGWEGHTRNGKGGHGQKTRVYKEIWRPHALSTGEHNGHVHNGLELEATCTGKTYLLLQCPTCRSHTCCIGSCVGSRCLSLLITSTIRSRWVKLSKIRSFSRATWWTVLKMPGVALLTFCSGSWTSTAPHVYPRLELSPLDAPHWSTLTDVIAHPRLLLV